MKTGSRRFLSLTGCLLIAAGALAWMSRESPIATAQVKQAPVGGATHLPAPVLEVKPFMDVFNKPLYAKAKKALGDKPDSDEDWKEIENTGWQVAEIANLLAIRHVPPGASGALQKHSAELQMAGSALARGAKAKNYDQVRNDWSHLVETCNACHKEIAPDKAPQLRP